MADGFNAAADTPDVISLTVDLNLIVFIKFLAELLYEIHFTFHMTLCSYAMQLRLSKTVYFFVLTYFRIYRYNITNKIQRVEIKSLSFAAK